MISSRRKSGSACARGKRRCDLGFPQCGRCLARRVTCVYAWISPQEAQEVVKTINPSLWVPQESPHNYLDQSGPTETSQSSDDLPRPGERHANNHTTFGPAPLTLSPALVPLIDEITGRGSTISFLAPGPQLQFLDKSYPNAGSHVHTPQPPHNIGIPPTPFQGAGGSSMYTGKIFQARAEYAASRLVRQVRTLAETGQTSIIHHSHSLIRSEIARRAELLIEATETAISLTPPSSHSAMNFDLLHAVQAMLIYQCMRLFSTGDIAQQTQAELDAKSLARWVDILQEQTQWSWDNFSSGTQLDFVWKDWLLDGIYTFLRFGWYQPSARMANLGFTGQVAIWEARSPAEWHQARGQKPWVELNISSFHDGIKAAFPDDLDELGIIILVSYNGVDVLEEWVGDDKRLLKKWGLSAGNDFFSSCY
ncbi:uncharacterized protein FOBCDRAFT_241861 [Fusarium oxysporum Fo47]|uniref:uncharacterized protein n=1 Tax=Fusarium oxysporum Fo47 TaxID=660027 RepID=UPI00286987C8|nr:uncharacterized protein FOBCDRAFT_241861 [Fusarium oxysporum Fo47]QKD57294.2 hypothetical protein FOBCDRAFT_241861 [Fusarium oxysporum Fo47]